MKVFSLVQPDMKRVMDIVTRFMCEDPVVGNIPFLFSEIYGEGPWLDKLTDVLIGYDTLEAKFLDVPLSVDDIEIKQLGKFIQVSVRFNDHLYFVVDETMPEFEDMLPNVTLNPYVKASRRTHRLGDDGYLNCDTIKEGVVMSLLAKDLFSLDSVWEETETGLFVIHKGECLKATKNGDNYYTIETSNGEWLTYLLVKHLHAMNPTANKTLLDIEAHHRLDIMPAHIVQYGEDGGYNIHVKTFTVSKEAYPALLDYLKEKRKV